VARAGVVEIARSGAVLQVDPSDGGRIVSLSIAGGERIVPKTRVSRMTPPIFWGSFPMAPWAGRLAGGRVPTVSGEAQLEPNLGRSAIHGLVFDRPWDIVARTADALTMTCELHGRGWPFGGRATQTLRLGTGGLQLGLEVGGYTRPGPAGVGWHPWFARPSAGDLALRVDASEVLVVDDELIPTGATRDVTNVEDLRSGPLLGDRRLDHVYVRVSGPAILRWPDLELRIAADGAARTVVVHTPLEGICVEHQTMWPNAPLLAEAGVRDTGLRMLEPGDSLRATAEWSWLA
jgi:aldose 1-epimerase